MDQRKIGWIGAVSGIAIGVFGALLGILLWPYTGEYEARISPGAIKVLVWGSVLGGVALGVMGGVLGTYFSVKNTKGPRERAFVVRASVLCCALVLAFLAGMLLIPGWYKHLLVVAYVILLVYGVRGCNQAQMRIRRQESGERA